MEEVKDSVLEFGVAAMAMPGFSESGDRHVFQRFGEGALVAVIDGIGHGAHAAAAATRACEILESNAGDNIISLVTQCHDKLKGTRGVAMSLASLNFRHGLMTWMGIGNVQGEFLRAELVARDREESLLLRPGVVGSHLPPLQASVLPILAGSSLIFASDGIRSDFDRSYVRSQPAGKAAESILARYAKKTDDALVLVARYRGIV